jgi:thiosulfate reductase cytochrome b subunit
MSNTRLVFIYKRYERFWHWTQALLILFLALTGFEIHGSYSLLGFQAAVVLHDKAAWALIILIIFTIFWHFTTGEWRQYLPTTENLKAQIRFYVTGIFTNAPHPTRKTLLSKLNPLQRLVYLSLKILFIPAMIISGLAYMFYRYPSEGVIKSLGIPSIENIAFTHTLGAYIMLSFVIVHVYLITTGHTLTTNLKAMITGWEEIPVDNMTEETHEQNISRENKIINEKVASPGIITIDEGG